MKQQTYRIRVDIASSMLLGEVQPDIRSVLQALRDAGVLKSNKDFPQYIEYDTAYEPSKHIAIWKRNGFSAQAQPNRSRQ